MGKNVAVFVDVANIFYAAKAAGVDIDYVTLLKASTVGRDLVRAYAYTGLDPDNENQRNFHAFLARHGYKVVSKDIRKYGDGKVKANLDIELVVDMMKTARNLDIAIVVSGDGDFAPAIRAVQEQGVRVEVISFRGNTSSDLIDVADVFTDIIHVARVEKGSTRSGRRVAGDEEDLSMTEVPDKQTEGTGRGRGRGRTGRGRAGEVAARGAGQAAAAITVLPGERLSKAASAPEAPEDEESLAAVSTNGTDAEADADGGRRRRRRRGGRGRGRGRGGEAVGGEVPGGEEADEIGRPLTEDDMRLLEVGRGEERRPAREEARPARAPREVRAPREERPPVRSEPAAEVVREPAAEVVREPAPERRQPTPFGSVWDSQLGRPAAVSSTAPGPQRSEPLDEDDFEEPEIPEYLIAERNRQGGRGGTGNRGGRGGRSAYASALDRERFGGARGTTVSRFAEPARRGPQRPAGPRPAPRRDERVRESASGDPWTEVPPELEAQLRAQLAGRPSAGNAQGGRGRADEAARTEPVEAAPTAGRTRRPRRTAAAEATTEAANEATAPATVEASKQPATPTTGRRTTRSSAATVEPPAGGARGTEPSPEAPAEPAPRTRRRTSRATVDAAEAAAAAPESGDSAPAAPARRRMTRRPSPAVGEGGGMASESAAEAGGEPAPAPRRRTRRTTTPGA